jgi:hypothetical protein
MMWKRDAKDDAEERCNVQMLRIHEFAKLGVTISLCS